MKSITPPNEVGDYYANVTDQQGKGQILFFQQALDELGALHLNKLLKFGLKQSLQEMESFIMLLLVTN